jgi:alkanesulfonate monooxygenase SsuD/methylene tetrahydromethanopterin reductase-like flavin-dependent oxidoreductase (luciferase family)
MKFGILFTSHPNHDAEPYPHRDVHKRVTAEIIEADRLGYDTAWIAEHHFSNEYGILPDPFSYIGYLAPQTQRIKLGTAVLTLPAYNPVRVAENAAFVDILTEGRFVLGIGSGYRPYEFEGLGIDFEARRDIQEEAIPILLDALHKRKVDRKGKYFSQKIIGKYEIFPVALQQPHPPLFMAAGSERSIAFAGRYGFGLMLSSLPSIDVLAGQVDQYRASLKDAPPPFDTNPAFGDVDIARWVYVADSDDEAKMESEDGIIRHLTHFLGKSTAGYLGAISEKDQEKALDYDELARTTLLHGSPETVAAKIRRLRDEAGMTSLLLHFPPYYGTKKAMKSLRLFAERVMPEFKDATEAGN